MEKVKRKERTTVAEKNFTKNKTKHEGQKN